MERLSARQFAEWMAYERAFGPIDGWFSREMLAQLHELIQVNNQLTGASLTKRGRKNPAGKFRKVPRPWRPDLDDDPDEDDDEDEFDYGDPVSNDIRKFDAEVFGTERTQTLDDNYQAGDGD